MPIVSAIKSFVCCCRCYKLVSHAFSFCLIYLSICDLYSSSTSTYSMRSCLISFDSDVGPTMLLYSSNVFLYSSMLFIISISPFTKKYLQESDKRQTLLTKEQLSDQFLLFYLYPFYSPVNCLSLRAYTQVLCAIRTNDFAHIHKQKSLSSFNSSNCSSVIGFPL